MFRASTSGICLILLIITSGCGTSKKDSPIQMSLEKAPDQAKVASVQSLLDEYVSALNSSVTKLDKVVDKASAMSAAEELTKSAKRFREIASELKSVDKLNKAEHAQLSMKGIQTTMANFSKVNKRVLAKIQEGAVPPDANKALQEAYEDFGKASMEISEVFKSMEL